MQGNSSVITTIIVGAIIIGAAAYGIYTTDSLRKEIGRSEKR
jgi:hypothetical protein